MSKVKIATSGEYSDYSVIAVLEWHSDLTPQQALEKFLAEHPLDPEVHDRFEPDRFVGWLSLGGYATDLEADELYLGDYGNIPNLEKP